MNSFRSADILLPREAELSLWSVVACDQFTSEPAYWQRVRARVGDEPSALKLILPEAELGSENPAERIHETMRAYLDAGLFERYENAFVYVERGMASGAVRRGLVGAVDLEAYDYSVGSKSDIRATEQTVVERIPPRMAIRRGAALELTHVILLCDDERDELLAPITAQRDSLPKLYDFELMEGGGHIAGWLVAGEAAEAFERRLTAYAEKSGGRYADLEGAPMTFAVGDGNHSLATAKACYEERKRAHPGEDLSRHPARYALVELENLHDDAQVFEPIHRILTHVDARELLAALKTERCGETGFPVEYVIGDERGQLYLDSSRGELTVGILQSFLDSWLQTHQGEIDYIHGEETLLALAAQENAIGFLLPPMMKHQLFRGVIADGALPRKTFSMGHAQEKRYYLEARRIDE